MEIDVIGEQKWKVILEILWLARHNPEIDWKIGEVKITRYPEECVRQWRPKQGKPGWKNKKKKRQRKRQQRNEKKK